jgi:CHAT domain-containing protein
MGEGSPEVGYPLVLYQPVKNLMSVDQTADRLNVTSFHAKRRSQPHHGDTLNSPGAFACKLPATMGNGSAMAVQPSNKSYAIGRRRLIPAKSLCLLLLLAVRLVTGTAETTPDALTKNGQIELTAGSDISRELAADAKDVFGIWLNHGDLLRLSIDKGDFAVSLTIYDPEQKKLLEQVSYGFENLPLSIPAESAGRYLLEIHSLELKELRRRYELKIEPLSPATKRDQISHAAQRAAASATILRAQWTEEALHQAIEKYEEAALIWHSLHDLRNEAVAGMNAAEICLVLGQYREGLKRYQKAGVLAKRAGARLEESRSLSEVGLLQSHLGDNDRANKNVVEAMKLLGSDSHLDQPAIFQINYAKNLLNLGEVSYSKGNFVKSLKEFEDALKRFDKLGDRSGSAKAHLFLGYISGSIGAPEKAVAEVSKALHLYRAMKNKAGEGWCLTVLGLAQSVSRTEVRAISLHREAIDIFRQIGDRQSEAFAVNGLGQAYEYLKDFSTSLEHYQRALQLFQDNGSLDFASVALLSVGKMYGELGDTEQALAYYERCLRLSRAANKLRSQANALAELALLYAAAGKREKTISQYQKILKFYASISDIRGQATAWNYLGKAYLRFAEKQKALASFKKSLSLSEQAGDKAALVSAMYNVALTQRDLGDLEAALATIKKSIEINEDLRTNVSSQDFRISYFTGVRDHYDLCGDILMRLDRLRPGQGFAAAAFLMSEKGRARSLLDTLTEARADVRQDASPELIDRERYVRGLLRAQAAYQMDLSVSGKDSAEKEEVARQIKELAIEYQEIEAQIKDRNPRILSIDQSIPSSLEQIQKQLQDDHSILLEFGLGEDRSYLWAVTGNSFQSYELPSQATLEGLARDVYQFATARQEVADKVAGEYQANVAAADKAYHEKASLLSQWLFGQVASQLGTKRILIVTEGVLQFIPFDALPALQPQPVGLTKGAPAIPGEATVPSLLDTNEVVVLPSMSILTAIRRQRHNVVSGDKIVAVFADPVFNPNDDRVRGGVVSETSGSDLDGANRLALRGLAGVTRDGGPGRLVHASEEIDAILRATPPGSAIVAKDFDANRETVMRPFVGGYQIIHFATHGFYNSEYPELSGIVLAMVKPDGSKVNGFLPLQDIYKMDLSAQLVVLSACDTALGKEMKGEGLIGLTRGFMYAGSRSVVTSLWKVDDRATAALMKHFYQAMLRDGMTPAAALRSAKQKIRREKAWSAPYFWAGFVLQGEYKERIVVESSSSSRMALVISMALIVFSSAAIILHWRRRARSNSP